MTFFETRGAATRRQGAAIACVVVVAGFVSGCARTNEQAPWCNMSAINDQRNLVAVPGPDGREPPVVEVPLNSVSMLDATITSKVYVRDATAKRTPAGTVEVRSQIANCTDFPLQVELRTQFMDAENAPSEAVSAWRRVYLTPRSNGSYHESSIGTTAVKSYIIEVREGR